MPLMRKALGVVHEYEEDVCIFLSKERVCAILHRLPNSRGAARNECCRVRRVLRRLQYQLHAVIVQQSSIIFLLRNFPPSQFLKQSFFFRQIIPFLCYMR